MNNATEQAAQADPHDDLRRLAEAATPGPWFDAYSGVHSKPLVDECYRLEREIPDDAGEDDPRWDALPETGVCAVPTFAGDLPTSRGQKDAAFIAAAHPQQVLALLDEIRSLRRERDAMAATLRNVLERMSENDTEAFANHAMLRWARERAGMSVEDAAARIDRFANYVESCEAGWMPPTIAELRGLAAAYGVPLAAFWLPPPPEEPRPRTDEEIVAEAARRVAVARERAAEAWAKAPLAGPRDIAAVATSEADYFEPGGESVEDDLEDMAQAYLLAAELMRLAAHEARARAREAHDAPSAKERT